MHAQIPPEIENKVGTELRYDRQEFQKVLENCWAQLGRRADAKQTSKERLLEAALIFAEVDRGKDNRLSWEEWQAILQDSNENLHGRLKHAMKTGSEAFIERVASPEVIDRLKTKYAKADGKFQKKLEGEIEKFKKKNPEADPESERAARMKQHEEERCKNFLRHQLSYRKKKGSPYIGLLLQEILLEASRAVFQEGSAALTVSLKKTYRKNAPQPPRGTAYLCYALRSNIEEKLRAKPSRSNATALQDSLKAVEAALGGLNVDPKREDALSEACRAFCEAFASDRDLKMNRFCHLGFYRDHYLNRTEYLYDPAHVKYPEVSNFVWRQGDLPTTLLMKERALLYPPWPTDNLSLEPDPGKPVWEFDRVGRFQYREDSDHRRVLCFRLEWSPQAAPVVLFLNWRQAKDGALPGKEFLHPVWDAVDQALAEADRVKKEEALRHAVFPLKLATIHFQEWLAAHRLESPAEWKARQRRRGENSHPRPMEPIDLCRRVNEAASHGDLSHRLNTLALYLNKALGLGAGDEAGPKAAGRKRNDCRVYKVEGNWNEDPRKDERYVVFPDEEKKGLRPPEGVREVPGQCPLRIEPDEKRTPKNEPGKRKTPRMGSCATACLWETALLLDFPEGKVTTELTKLCIERADVDRRAEIVVPILDDNSRAVAVVNWVSSECLEREKMRYIELITHLYQRLRAVYERGKDKDREWMNGLLQDAGPKTSQGILKAYCEEVRSRLGADLVRVLIYDARSGILIPQGISLSQATASRFLVKERSKVAGENTEAVETLEKAYHADKPFADFQAGSSYQGLPRKEQDALGHLLGRLDRPFPKGQDYKALRRALHALLEHAISLRLITRHHGNTWNTFVDQELHFVLNADQSPDVSAEARLYFRAIMGIPFRHHPDAQAAGVLAISWGKEDRVGDADFADLLKELQDEKALPEGRAKARRNDFIRAVENRVGHITEAVAAVHNLFRYCDPETAINILPP